MFFQIFGMFVLAVVVAAPVAGIVICAVDFFKR